MTVPSFIEEKLGNGVSLTTVTEDQSSRSRLIALDETDETAPYEASGTVINAMRAYFKVDAAILIKTLFNIFSIIIPLLKHELITSFELILAFSALSVKLRPSKTVIG